MQITNRRFKFRTLKTTITQPQTIIRTNKSRKYNRKTRKLNLKLCLKNIKIIKSH